MAALVVVILTLCVTFASAQTIRLTVACDTNLTRSLGSVLVDGSITDTLVLTSGFPKTDLTRKSLRFRADSNFDGLNLTLPPSFDSGSPVTQYITFHPKDTGLFRDTLFLVDTSCTDTIIFFATGLVPDTNGSIFSLLPNGQNVIGFQSDTNRQRLTVKFQNNVGDTIEILPSSVFLFDTTNFSISRRPDSAVILKGGEFSFEVEFNPSALGFHSATMVIRPSRPVITEAFSLQGVRFGSLAVVTRPSDTAPFFLYPNPSHGPVILGSNGVTRGHVTITNILGQVIRDEAAAGDWIWDGMSSAGSAVPAGTYYVIASGISASGKYVQQVLPLVRSEP